MGRCAKYPCCPRRVASECVPNKSSRHKRVQTSVRNLRANRPEANPLFPSPSFPTTFFLHPIRITNPVIHTKRHYTPCKQALRRPTFPVTTRPWHDICCKHFQDVSNSFIHGLSVQRPDRQLKKDIHERPRRSRHHDSFIMSNLLFNI